MAGALKLSFLFVVIVVMILVNQGGKLNSPDSPNSC